MAAKATTTLPSRFPRRAIVANAVNFYTLIRAGLYGGDGDDFLDGGRGNNSLFGGNDDDTLLGGEGQ